MNTTEDSEKKKLTLELVTHILKLGETIKRTRLITTWREFLTSARADGPKDPGVKGAIRYAAVDDQNKQFPEPIKSISSY